MELQLFTFRTQLLTQNGMIHDEDCVQVGFSNLGGNQPKIVPLNLVLPPFNGVTYNSTNIFWLPVNLNERDMTRYTVAFPPIGDVSRNKLLVFFKVPVKTNISADGKKKT